MSTIVETWRQYSVAERDRRWNAVRAGAAKAGLDCVFVPLGNSTDARYLTQIRGAVQSAAIVRPTERQPARVLQVDRMDESRASSPNMGPTPGPRRLARWGAPGPSPWRSC